MRVYHASNCIVDAPDVLHSRSFLDFGRGFYVTRMKDQAERYGERFMRRGQQAFVSEYELNEGALAALKVLEFGAYDDAWFDFVMACRRDEDCSDWDVVIGGIANDRVFATVDLFTGGEITRAEALGRLAFVKPNDQICLRTQNALDVCLRFIGSEALT